MAGYAVNATRLTTYTSVCLSLYWSDPDELKLSDVYVEIEAVPASHPLSGPLQKELAERYLWPWVVRGRM